MNVSLQKLKTSRKHRLLRIDPMDFWLQYKIFWHLLHEAVPLTCLLGLSSDVEWAFDIINLPTCISVQ